MQRSCIVDVPSMEGLGRRAWTTMSMPSFCTVDDEHNAAGCRWRELTRWPEVAMHLFIALMRTRSIPPQPLTDCPAQHGGAKRPQPTEIVQPLSHAPASEKRGRDRLSTRTVAPCSYAGGKFRLRASLALDTARRSQQEPRQPSLRRRNLRRRAPLWLLDACTALA